MAEFQRGRVRRLTCLFMIAFVVAKDASPSSVEVARAAAAVGLVASAVPKAEDPGQLHLPGRANRHVAFVIAVASDRFEVVEQN